MKESVWYVIPSKRKPEECAARLQRWRDQGYNIALFVDRADEAEGKPNDLVVVGEYRGYPATVNRLMKMVFESDAGCSWCVTGGDDMLPDPNVPALTIARQCSLHFVCVNFERLSAQAGEPLPEHLRFNAEAFSQISPEKLQRVASATFGVMQPTGDRWGEHETVNNHAFVPPDPRTCGEPSFAQLCVRCWLPADHAKHLLGAYIDRVAGSPWIGREFARRVYRGNGPFWPEFYHMFDDEHLQCVATKLGVFWQRRDLTHLHEHWGRPREGERLGQASRMPDFLVTANSRANWDRSKAIFERLKAGGFAEAEDVLP